LILDDGNFIVVAVEIAELRVRVEAGVFQNMVPSFAHSGASPFVTRLIA
jgi:hypothetical protein